MTCDSLLKTERLLTAEQASRKDEAMLRRKLAGHRAIRGVHASWFQGINLVVAPAYDENAAFEVMSC